ncbi:MAG: hypothetical protein ACM3KH_00695 [Thiobacillus sp.]
MQSDDQNNYWQDKPESDQPTEMYQPNDQEEASAAVSAPDKSDKNDDTVVHWSAEEYIHQEKDTLWFVVFGIIVLGLMALDIFYIKSYTFSALVVVMAIAVIVFSRRPPRIIDYTLSHDQGLYIGDKLHHFSEFKSFGLVQDSGRHSIMLIPVKRFAPGVSVYFPEEAGERIVDIFGTRLPMQDLKLDFVDVLVRKLRL